MQVIERVLLCLAAAWIALSTPLTVLAADTVTVGILAMRPKDQERQRWQPLADYLDETVPGRKFEIGLFSYPELEAAIAGRRVDFVLTNPAHYVLMAHRNGLSARIATLADRRDGTPPGMLGGAILVRSERSDLRTLADLRGRTVATNGVKSLGGFQAQAYELLQAGLHVPEDLKVVETGMPQDLAVEALLAGRVDAAFVRTGVVEAMSREGRLDPGRIRVLGTPDAPALPIALSTRLYPEWPMAVMPQTDPTLGRHVAAALLSMAPDGRAARAMDIRGFTVPADYEGVRALMQELRLPPYDTAPRFTLADVWQRYHWHVLAALAALLLIAALAVALLLNRRALLGQRRAALDQARALAAGEARFRSLHELSPAGMLLNRVRDRVLLEANPALCRMLGYAAEDLTGRDYRDLLIGSDARIRAALDSTGRYGPIERQLRRRDGGRISASMEGVLLHDEREGDLVYSVIQDIGEQKRLERSHWELGLFTGGPVAVFVWLPADGWPVAYVSPNVVDLLGYTAEEVRATDFRFADLIHPDDVARIAAEVTEYLGDGRAQFEQSYRLRDKQGEYRWFYDFTVPERDAGGAVVRIRGYMFDLSKIKQAEEALAHERQRLEAIIEGTNVGTWEWDVQDGGLAINERWAEIVGYRLDELAPLGIETWNALAHPEDLKTSGKLLERHFRGDLDYYDCECRMRHKDGHWVWVHDRGKVVKRSDDGRPLRMSGTHADITRRKEAEEQIQRLAFYDPLTGLPNRRLMLDRLGQAQAVSERSRRYGALLLIDLDHFKTLNDTMGHGMGDRLLVEAARRLSACVRAGDTVARLGGDEFVAILPDLDENQAEAAKLAETVAEKLRTALNAPYALDDARLGSYHNTPSIGISLFRDQEDSLDSLLSQSDMAMYQAKHAGRNAIRFYSPQMQAAIDARAAIEAGLRRAIDSGELMLHYQPQVDRDGGVIGAEALLRWQRSGRRQFGPDQFIPIAEESGLILPIGNWVLDIACATLKSWDELDYPGKPRLAVNVSARQFHQADFVERIRATLERYQTEPTRLKLELTESMVLDSVEDSIAKMRKLKELGVSFSLDDFGTGYSSLSYLKRLPFDQLKIDRSFVRDIASDPDDAAIVQAILDMSHALRLEVVAEGVESEFQRDFLQQCGCQAFQGYLFGRPQPLAEFEKRLN